MDISSIGKMCVGCGSCQQSCVKKAIYMNVDEEEFLYPYINKDLCVSCGKCLKVCPANEKCLKPKKYKISAYSGFSTDTEIVKKSSSGGAFSVMADYVLKNNGVVFGAIFDKNNKSIVYSNTDQVDLDCIRRSKYVSSEVGDVYSTTEQELKKGRMVLFCGLPCHIAGLKSFLSGEYERLITCDFICGGVASPLFFREHLKYLEKKNSSFVVDINFRAKLLGWREHSLLIEFENGHKYKMSGEADSFFSGYFKKVYQRDSCYACRYRLNHMSDVIIADYWGGAGSTDNNAGMSMVIGNSKKGNDFFREVLMEESHAFEEMPADNTSYAFKTETERYMAAYPQKSKFYDTYNQYGFETAARKTYLSNYKKLYLKWIIKRLLRKYR